MSIITSGFRSAFGIAVLLTAACTSSDNNNQFMQLRGDALRAFIINHKLAGSISANGQGGTYFAVFKSDGTVAIGGSMQAITTWTLESDRICFGFLPILGRDDCATLFVAAEKVRMNGRSYMMSGTASM